MPWYHNVLMEKLKRRPNYLQLKRKKRMLWCRWLEFTSCRQYASIIFEPDERVKHKLGAHAEHSLLELNDKRSLWVPLDNPTGFTINIQAGEVLGSATEAAVIQSQEEDPPQEKVLTARVSSEEASGREKRRQEKL
jgi:hypothetical protein